MTNIEVYNELDRIKCSTKFVGNIEGISVDGNCSRHYVRFLDDCQTMIINTDLLQNFFSQLEDGCGCRKFWELVHELNSQKEMYCTYCENEGYNR